MNEGDPASATAVSRRQALKTLAMGVGAVVSAPGLTEAAWAQALAVRAQAASTPATGLKFLTAAQHRTVDVLSDLIIPADSRSPGASAAKVADFIDLLLSGAREEDQTVWREGLPALDRATTRRFRRPFTECTAAQQVAMLTEMSRREDDPQSVLEKLFGQLKERTLQGYYTSQIGIHEELGYQGNQFLAEFVGCNHPEHIA